MGKLEATQVSEQIPGNCEGVGGPMGRGPSSYPGPASSAVPREQICLQTTEFSQPRELDMPSPGTAQRMRKVSTEDELSWGSWVGGDNSLSSDADLERGGEDSPRPA